MLTQEENELLTRVGPGTPAGELLRRYWHPVAVAQELTAENPTRFVRILGEDLVLFRDKKGRVGLITDRCPHRGASFLYGRVEERGIACAYHGWLFDTEGDCLECPAEPAESKFHLTVKHTAYPVQKFAGLYWAYMGPKPAPAIPKYDLLMRKDGKRRIAVFPQLDCNWLTATENALDPSHLQVLHQDLPMSKRRPVNTTRGFIDDIESFDFYPTSYGIMKKRIYKNGAVDEHPFIFPTHLRTRGSLWLRTPVDDTHTLQIVVHFRRAEGEGSAEDEEPSVEYIPPYKNPPEALHPFTRFDLYAPQGQPLAQDCVMWETQGPIADRAQERLGVSDRGIVMLREMLKKEIEKARKGLDPIGIVRDPDHPMIDTNLTKSITMDYPSGIVAKTAAVK